MPLLAALALLFGRLSLLAIGGVNSTVPEIAREVVGVRHWLSPAQFAQLFAISNAAPGPNVMISTVIGAHLAGPAGGVVATLAMILPSGVLVAFIATLWERYREAPLRRIIQRALLPITAGLLLAAAGVLARQADTDVLTLAITLAGGALIWRTRLHPLWVLGGGAALGLVFLR